MRFTVDTAELNAAVATVSKALGVKSSVGILEGIYAEAIGDTLLLRCTDLSLQIEATLNVNIQKEGACVLPGRLFSELVRRLPAEETLLSLNKSTLLLESGRATPTMQVENPEEHDTPVHIRNGPGRFQAHTPGRAHRARRRPHEHGGP